MEHAVGKDMAALAVGTQLRFVDGGEGYIGGHRHGFSGAEQIARILGLDPLLTGDQRDLCRPLDRADLVIDLARQQAQREADHAG